MKKLRLFVAINLPAEIRGVLVAVQHQLRHLPYTVKWVEERNFHLTLAFLGEVEETRLPTLENALGQALHGFTAFNLSLSQIGAFPHLRQPRVLWVGLSGNTKKANLLSQQIHKALSEQGFTLDNKPFRPHLTLGRVKSRKVEDYRAQKLIAENDLEQIAAQQAALLGHPFSVDKVELMQSELTPQGPIYSVLKTYPC
ncbi:MAG: RNA 2',3'-cyclic phosphodiesterase [Syntrophomonadaceae bacterium]|nr:RNA 2',3'-cyclic phosphodiesterase [Syntrophomonadaceae bacterium]